MGPVAAFCWVMFMGFIGSGLADDGGAPVGWLFFAATAPMPLSGWRFFSKEKSNLFDWLGYVAGTGGWLVSMLYGVKPNYGLDPLSASIGALFSLIPAMGLHGLFSIPAFLLDQMPKRAPRMKRKPQMPYSATADSDLGFDPSRFGNVGGPGRPQGGGGSAAGQGAGPQGRMGERPKWAAILETVLIGYDPETGPQSRDRSGAETQRREQQARAAREAKEKAERERQAREARERQAREREAQAQAERNRQQQEEIKRLRQRSADDDYKDALDLFDLKPGYTLGELRKRYRELSQSSHPDKGGTSGLFRKVHEAFELLSRRAK